MRLRSCAAITWRTTASVAGLAFVVVPPPAGATGETVPINGIFTATSNGQWAQTNEVFHDQPTVRSTWTIKTACVNALSCTGTVKSDRGWTATIYTTSNVWYVKRDEPNWEPCPDGTSAVGHQIYHFYAVGADGTVDPQSATYAGKDETSGPSGACGKNLPLVISLPFKLVKIA